MNRNHMEFEDFVREWDRNLYGFILARATLDHQTILDIKQEVWMTVYQKWSSFREPEKVIWQIARNKIADWWRANRHRLTEVGSGELHEAALIDAYRRASADNADPADLVERRQTTLRRLKKLPERQREILLLRYFCDFDIETISNICGIGKESVKTHIARAKKALSLDPALSAAMNGERDIEGAK